MMSHKHTAFRTVTALGVTAAWMASTQPLRSGRSTASTPDMSVSVTAAQRNCFTDIVQLTGVVVPRNEILVRPDRKDSRYRRFWSKLATA